MTDKPDSKLEEFLDGTSSVSRAYAELGREQPPQELDRAILAAARDAVTVEEDATVIRVRRWHKWSVSAALAATVVVAVPLAVRVVDLGIDEPRPVQEAPAIAARRDAAGEAKREHDEALQDAEADARRQALPAPGRAPVDLAESANAGQFAQAPPSAHDAGIDEAARRPTGAIAQRADSAPDSGTNEQTRRLADAMTTAPDSMPAQRAESGNGARLANAPAASEALTRLREAAPPEETAPPPDERLAKSVEDSQDAATAMLRASPPAAPSLAELDEPADADTTGRQSLIAESFRQATLAREAQRNSTGAAARPDYLSPEHFAERIVALHRRGQTEAARRELGELLVLHPGAELPADFPLERAQAIYPQRPIVREADDWLGAIAALDADGRTDAARQELARFFEVYRDYTLPVWFPLTRADAAPIEQ